MNGTPCVDRAGVQPAGLSRNAYEFANAATPADKNRAPCSGTTQFQPR